MTDTCLHLIEIETFSKRNGTELTDIDASYQALIDSIDYKLHKQEEWS